MNETEQEPKNRFGQRAVPSPSKHFPEKYFLRPLTDGQAARFAQQEQKPECRWCAESSSPQSARTQMRRERNLRRLRPDVCGIPDISSWPDAWPRRSVGRCERRNQTLYFLYHSDRVNLPEREKPGHHLLAASGPGINSSTVGPRTT